jgi:uncharacterized protein (DUF305 family)
MTRQAYTDVDGRRDAGDRGLPTILSATSQQLPGDPRPRPELIRQPYAKADVEFMQGMIPHHAQAS